MRCFPLLIFLLLAGGAQAGIGDFRPGELIVRFVPGVDADEALTIATDAGAISIEPRYAPRHWLARTAADPLEMESVAQSLLLSARVEAVTFNYLGAGGFLPADTLFSSQWHLEQDNGVDINAAGAWDVTRGDAGIVVAVLDSGITFDQPEFADRLATNADEFHNGVDDDGNGLIDDVDGWDFVGNYDAADNDPSDEHGHGTWVSSAIAANADGRGVAGVDHAARVLPLRVLDANNRGAMADLIDAIYYAIDAGVDIINMSLINFPVDAMLGNALATASGSGAVLVACAGNDGQGTADSQYPGAHPDTLSVGSTDRNDLLAGFSSTGTTVSLSAPGESILVADHEPPFEEDKGAVVNGCSLATPITAGVVSLLLSVQPDLTQAEIETLLAQTATDLGPAGWDSSFGWGRIDADAALRGAVTVFSSGFED